MKRLLLPLLAALSFPTAVNANVDPKVAEMCMKAVDFQGCVNAMTGVNKNAKNKEELLNEIRKLPSRISNTSLRDLSGETRSFRDKLALSSPEEVGLELYENAKKLESAIDILYSTWQRKIEIQSSEWLKWSPQKNYETGQRLNRIFGGLTLDIRCTRYGFVIQGQDITFAVRLLINTIAKEMANSEGKYYISQETYKIPATAEIFCPGDPRRPVKVRKEVEESTKPKKPNCPNPVWKVSGQKYVCE